MGNNVNLFRIQNAINNRKNEDIAQGLREPDPVTSRDITQKIVANMELKKMLDPAELKKAKDQAIADGLYDEAIDFTRPSTEEEVIPEFGSFADVSFDTQTITDVEEQFDMPEINIATDYSDTEEARAEAEEAAECTLADIVGSDVADRMHDSLVTDVMDGLVADEDADFDEIPMTLGEELVQGLESEDDRNDKLLTEEITKDLEILQNDFDKEEVKEEEPVKVEEIRTFEIVENELNELKGKLAEDYAEAKAKFNREIEDLHKTYNEKKSELLEERAIIMERDGICEDTTEEVPVVEEVQEEIVEEQTEVQEEVVEDVDNNDGFNIDFSFLDNDDEEYYDDSYSLSMKEEDGQVQPARFVSDDMDFDLSNLDCFDDENDEYETEEIIESGTDTSVYAQAAITNNYPVRDNYIVEASRKSAIANPNTPEGQRLREPEQAFTMLIAEYSEEDDDVIVVEADNEAVGIDWFYLQSALFIDTIDGRKILAHKVDYDNEIVILYPIIKGYDLDADDLMYTPDISTNLNMRAKMDIDCLLSYGTPKRDHLDVLLNRGKEVVNDEIDEAILEDMPESVRQALRDVIDTEDSYDAVDEDLDIFNMHFDDL